MSLTPPTSRDASSIAGVTVEPGNTDVGKVLTIVNASPAVAAWEAAGGGSAGRLFARIGALPIGLIGETPESDFSQAAYVTVTSPPLVIAATGAVGSIGVSVFNVPDISDDLDINVVVFVTDQLGVNTGTVTAAFSTPTPISEYDVDLTGTTATITGTDLSWDGSTTFTSTAGGVYSVMLFVGCAPD